MLHWSDQAIRIALAILEAQNYLKHFFQFESIFDVFSHGNYELILLKSDLTISLEFFLLIS